MSKSKKKNNNVKDTGNGVSFGREYHSLQVIPDRHHATAVNITISNISTWNVRTMYQSGKMDNILKEMRRLSINILGVCEVRWPGAGKVISEGATFIYLGGTENKHEHGVGIFLDQESAKGIAGVWCISNRIMLVRLQCKPFDTVVIQCYAPTTDCNDDEIDKFYDQLKEAMKQCRSHDITIVMADFNAKIGQNEEGKIVGKYGLGQRNARGERLVEWCIENRMIVTNTHFKHHSRNLYTWKSPGDGCRNQIDFIMINERFRNTVKRVRTYPGADCNTDHILLSGKFKMRLKKVRRRKQKNVTNQFQLKLLKNENDIKKNFCQNVKDQYQRKSPSEDTRMEVFKECSDEGSRAVYTEKGEELGK
ncbi:craniofacial development protein 2-like [Anneissia japonica]|uniref:craniofacial development protein 2-like n=1 Tax=Anneissia japonica TaxID=1529436 RepID=UPI001425A002|nr:craniofacial development protein 2-like [Anneissia japonica]